NIIQLSVSNLKRLPYLPQLSDYVIYWGFFVAIVSIHGSILSFFLAVCVIFWLLLACHIVKILNKCVQAESVNVSSAGSDPLFIDDNPSLFNVMLRELNVHWVQFAPGYNVKNIWCACLIHLLKYDAVTALNR